MIPNKGWYVEVENTNTGHVFTPEVLGEPQRRPRANSFQEISIPLDRNEKWQSEAFEGAPLRVWYDGERQPIEQLDSVTITEERTVLVGRGGVDLKQQVKREVKFQKTHELLAEIVRDNTKYSATADAPRSSTQENKVVQDLQSQQDLVNNSEEIPATLPIEVVSGDNYGDGDIVRVNQTCYFQELEDVTTLYDVPRSGSSNGGGANLISSSSVFEYEVTTEYDIPTDRLKLYCRVYTEPGNSEPPFEIKINGNVIFDVNNSNFFGSSFDGHFWSDFTGVGYPGDVLPAGTHQVTFTGTGSGDFLHFDCAALLDSRYHEERNFDNTLDSNGYLSSPELFPVKNSPEITFDDAQVVSGAVEGGRTELNANDTSRNFQVSFSKDLGNSYVSGSNDPFETDFSSPGPSLRAKVRLGGTNSTRTTATPTQGFERQKVDKVVLKADITDTPLVVQRSFDGQVIDVLRELSGDDFLFEYRQSGGSGEIQITQPGQRTASPDDLTVSDYKQEKITGELVEKAVVYGGNQSVIGEQITADASLAISLENEDLQSASETVRTPSSSQIYTRDQDYEIDYSNGEVSLTSGSRISDGQTITVDYEFTPVASFSAEGISDPVTQVRNVPQLSTERACFVTAKQLVSRLKDPKYRAEITVAEGRKSWSVIESLTIPQLPRSEPLHLKQVTSKPNSTVYTLAEETSVSEILDDVRGRIDNISRRT